MLDHTLPTGTVTFLFTDIQGSTPLWESQPEKMAQALQIHNTTLRRVIEAHGGVVFKTVGDAFQAAFSTASQALRAAIAGQKALQAAPWNELGELKVRMGLHTGEAELDPGGDEYAVSHTKNRAARIMSAAHGGQILLSQETKNLVDRQLPEEVTLNDLGEHRLKGMQWLEHLSQVCAPGLQVAFPPLETSVIRPNYLPTQLTSFIGREQELFEIHALLADPACRLLTLFGPGGIGKTRLALEAARQQQDDFPDGVYFVPFAPVEAPEFAVQTLADGLELILTSQRDPLDQILLFLREKRILLVIDNFEHLLAAVDLLAETLRRTKTVKLLATSRERLNLQGEWVFNVQGLRHPTVGSSDQKDIDLANYEAIQLFLQTAQRTRSDFTPAAEDLTHIGRICQLVGGMPLGIELAASWVRLLPCAEIASEIHHNLDILSTSWRDVPERHRSIQAVLDYSWKLLTASERDVFRRLTVFNGSINREAAGAVADASLVMMLALVDKSFLQQVEENRFGIHELVKQYGSTKLQSEPEMWSTTRLRHCRYHAAFLEQRVQIPVTSAHLGEIERVYDDIQAAWHYAVEAMHLSEIQVLAAGFLEYYRLRSWYRAGSGAIELYQRALACFEPGNIDPEHKTTMACLYESLGNLHELATAREEALNAYEKALDSAPNDDPIRRGRLYGKIADAQVAMNQHERGDFYYRRAETELKNAPQRDASWWVEWFRIQLQRMELYYWQNRPDEIARLANLIHTQIEQHGSKMEQLHYLYLLGLMTFRQNRFFYSRDTITYHKKALELSLDTGNLGEIALSQFGYGCALLFNENLDEAETHFQIARKMSEQNGDLTLFARVVTFLTIVYRRRDDIPHVSEYAGYTLRIASEVKMPQYTGIAHAQYAWIAWRAGDLDETKRQAQAAISDWGGLGLEPSVMPFRWLGLFPLMGAAIQEEDIDQATQYARHIILPPQQRLHDDLTNVLEGAVTALDEGQFDAANHLLHRAFQLAQEYHYV